MPVPRLSIVVPTFDRRDSVICLLRALCSQTAAADTFEVIVVSDGSTDGTLEAVRNYAAPFSLDVLDQPRARLAAARNRGARASAGEIVLFLDDDMEPESGLVASHLASHRAAGVLGVVGRFLIVVLPDAAPVVRYRAATFADKWRPCRAVATGWPSTMSTVATSPCVETSFSAREGTQDFRAYGHEDYELALRIGKPAHRLVFDPAAVVGSTTTSPCASSRRTPSPQAAPLYSSRASIRTSSPRWQSVASPVASLSARAKIAAAVTLGRIDDRSHERIVKSLERSERRFRRERAAPLLRYDAAFSLLYWTGAERALYELGAPRYRLAIANVARSIREPDPTPTSL